MTLYHASTLCIDKPDVLHSRDNLDFGKGFYLTSLYEQAIRYSERFTRRGKEAFINVYELDEETPGFTIKTEALGRLKFEKPNHQLCILNGEMLSRHLHFIKAERV